jgi:Amt family ammonium transporter
VVNLQKQRGLEDYEAQKSSYLSVVGSCNVLAREFTRVAINTNLAVALGGVFAMISVWLMFGKPDLSMAMNGALAGLVAITAPCAFVQPWAALAIGSVAGVVVVLGVISVVLFILAAMGIVFKLIEVSIGLRVRRDEELRGLDIGEHGMESYSGFQIFATK